MIAKNKPKCGLCGKAKNLTKTECCGQWICDDESKYVMFSYARNSCHRNHRRLTLCAYHHAEGHSGDWTECAACREAFDTEDYVRYGTNEYNFRKLPNPPVDGGANLFLFWRFENAAAQLQRYEACASGRRSESLRNGINRRSRTLHSLTVALGGSFQSN